MTKNRGNPLERRTTCRRALRIIHWVLSLARTGAHAPLLCYDILTRPQVLVLCESRSRHMRTMLLRRPLFHAFLLTCSHDTRSPTGMHLQDCAREYVFSCMYIRCWRNHLLRVFLRKKWQRHRAFMWKCLLFRWSPFDGQLWSWIDTNNCVSSTLGAVFSCVSMLTRDLLQR